MLTEAAARWLLVLHTALGVAAVGAATHLVIWLRRFGRGRGTRRAVLRFGWVTLVLQVAAFAVGVVMYPTYKVEVRAAYLENASALVAAQEARQAATAQVMIREHGTPESAPFPTDLVRSAAQAARWFDVKEHWVALGILVSAALLLILSRWPPDRQPVVTTTATALAAISAATLWLAAVIGILTTAWRAV